MCDEKKSLELKEQAGSLLPSACGGCDALLCCVVILTAANFAFQLFWQLRWWGVEAAGRFLPGSKWQAFNEVANLMNLSLLQWKSGGIFFRWSWLPWWDRRLHEFGLQNHCGAASVLMQIHNDFRSNWVDCGRLRSRDENYFKRKDGSVLNDIISIWAECEMLAV